MIAAARYGEAETRARARLAAVEDAHGRESVQAADVLDVLVEALWRLEKAALPETRELAERALKIRQQVLGPEHPSVATSLVNLAILLMRDGQYRGARPLFERALALRERSVGPEHPEVASIVNAYGLLLQQLGEYDEARATLERALRIWERAFGPEHRSVALPINNLALLAVLSGDYAAARPLFERVVSIMDRVLPPNDPLLAGCRRGPARDALAQAGERFLFCNATRHSRSILPADWRRSAPSDLGSAPATSASCPACVHRPRRSSAHGRLEHATDR